MKAFQAAFVTATFAFFSLAVPIAWAQGHAEHIMVVPKDLTWADVPSLPPGAKIAVIEGPMNEAKPFTVRFLDCSAIGEICEDVVVGERKPSATFVCLGECAQRSTIDVGLVVAQQIAGDVMTPERACR